MKTKRKGVFETNSSSTHSISINFAEEAHYNFSADFELDCEGYLYLEENEVKEILDQLPKEWLEESLQKRSNEKHTE